MVTVAASRRLQVPTRMLCDRILGVNQKSPMKTNGELSVTMLLHYDARLEVKCLILDRITLFESSDYKIQRPVCISYPQFSRPSG